MLLIKFILYLKFKIIYKKYISRLHNEAFNLFSFCIILNDVCVESISLALSLLHFARLRCLSDVLWRVNVSLMSNFLRVLVKAICRAKQQIDNFIFKYLKQIELRFC